LLQSETLLPDVHQRKQLCLARLMPSSGRMHRSARR
jgi:hypothetical protein